MEEGWVPFVTGEVNCKFYTSSERPGNFLLLARYDRLREIRIDEFGVNELKLVQLRIIMNIKWIEIVNFVDM